GDDFFDLLIVGAVTMLMAHHRFRVSFVEQLLDLNTFGAGHCNRLLEGDEFRTAFHADLHKVEAQMRQGAKAIQVRLNLVGEGLGIGADFRIPNLRRSGFETRLIDVTYAGDPETRIGMKRLGMMHSALAHADDDY